MSKNTLLSLILLGASALASPTGFVNSIGSTSLPETNIVIADELDQTVPSEEVWADSQSGPNALWLGKFENPEFDNAQDTQASSVCACLGAIKILANDTCYSDLGLLMEYAKSESIIYIGSDVTVRKPINIWQDLSIVGVFCNIADPLMRPKIISEVSGTENTTSGIVITTAGLFQLYNFRFQTLRLKNVDFQSSKEIDGKPVVAPVVLAPLDNMDHQISMDIRNCNFENFLNRANGSVIAMNSINKLEIDSKTTFIRNRVEGFCDCYGGGAVSADYISPTSVVNINADFIDNEARFKFIYPNKNGSEHAEGAAINFRYVDGFVNIKGNFFNNSGNDGGAIAIKTLDLGTVNINGYFKDNFVVDGGAQSRAGAIRVFNLTGTLNIFGNYTNNTALVGRGGVFGGNYLYGNNSRLVLKGNFENNKALKLGAVVSMMGGSGGTHLDGKVIIDGSSTFNGNVNVRSQKQNIMWFKDTATLNEEQWKANSGQTLVFQQE